MARVRKLSLDLRPAMLDDLGLLPTLLWHIEHYTAQTQVRVNFKHSGLEKKKIRTGGRNSGLSSGAGGVDERCPPCHASEATVRLSTHRQTLLIEVEDRGSGFDVESVLTASETSGLAGMRERVVLAGRAVDCRVTAGSGTRLTAELSDC